MASPKKPIASADLIKQKAAAKAKLDELRQRQVAALEEGLDFEHSNEILMVNEHLAALDQAIKRATDREEREAQRLERQQTRDRAASYCTVLEDMDKKRLDQLEKVQNAANLLMSEIERYEACCAKTREVAWDAARFYNRQPVSLRRIAGIEYRTDDFRALSIGAVRDRLGGFLSAGLSRALETTQIGPLAWQNTTAHVGDWVTDEQRDGSNELAGGLIPNLEHIVKCIPAEADDE